MIFIDTGAFVARYRSSDAHHTAAKAGWAKITRDGPPCFTTDLVIAETITLLARYIGYRPAAERGRVFLSSAALTILRPTLEDETAALDLLEKFADQEVSFVDCVSFVMMKNRRVRRVFGFDRHFTAAGFSQWK
ncbi:MAG: type II toxin-antitoxin system VapC family toxin [Tepidisphaerales bacterium]